MTNSVKPLTKLCNSYEEIMLEIMCTYPYQIHIKCTYWGLNCNDVIKSLVETQSVEEITKVLNLECLKYGLYKL